MRKVKPLESGILNGILKDLVLKFFDLPALCTYLMMVCLPVVGTLVLRGMTELVFDNQFGIDQQDDGVVESSAADAEILLIHHLQIEGINIKMSVDGIDRVEYGVAFGCLPMPIRLKIFGEYLPYRIFHVLDFHAET